jgi:glycosyltransferase involved in cell wall biosynthesis
LAQKHGGAGAARNLGAKNAKGRILVFVDADMTFDEKFLEKLTEPILTNPTSPRLRGARGTFSKEEYVANWENVWARCWNINEGWEPKQRHPADYPDYQPVFRAILKSEFDKVGGFTPGGYDDDWSLYKKLGYEAANAPGAVFYHKNPSSLSEVFRQAKWVGKRKYKLGVIGYVVALPRSSLPVSIIVGLIKGLKAKDLSFVIFKIVYDFGIFTGILEYLFTKKGSK